MELYVTKLLFYLSFATPNFRSTQSCSALKLNTTFPNTFKINFILYIAKGSRAKLKPPGSFL